MIPSEDVAPTSTSHPEHFVRNWYIKIKAVIKKRKNVSVLFPITIPETS